MGNTGSSCRLVPRLGNRQIGYVERAHASHWANGSGSDADRICSLYRDMRNFGRDRTDRASGLWNSSTTNRTCCNRFGGHHVRSRWYSLPHPRVEADCCKQLALPPLPSRCLGPEMISGQESLGRINKDESLRATQHWIAQTIIAFPAAEMPIRWSGLNNRQDFIDPNTGRKIEISNQFTHNWISSDGQSVVLNSGGCAQA